MPRRTPLGPPEEPDFFRLHLRPETKDKVAEAVETLFVTSGYQGHGPEHIGITIILEDGNAFLRYPRDSTAADLVLLAVARADRDLVAPAAEAVGDRRNAPFTSTYRGAWVDHLLSFGEPVGLGTFSRMEKARLEKGGQDALALVEGGQTDKGSWMRITGRDASLLASRIGKTGMCHLIESRFSGRFRDGDVLPELYILVDDPADPKRAHVSVAAFRKADLVEGARTRMAERIGDATGYRNSDPYPDFAAEIEFLARIEDLSLEPNWLGRKVHASAKPEADPRPDRDEASPSPW